MARVVSTPHGRHKSDVSIDLDLLGDALFIQFARAIVKPIASGGRKRELRRVADELLGQIGAAQPSNLALGVGMAVVALIGSTEKADLGQDVDAVTLFLQLVQWEDEESEDDGREYDPVNVARRLRENAGFGVRPECDDEFNDDSAEGDDESAEGDDDAADDSNGAGDSGDCAGDGDGANDAADY